MRIAPGLGGFLQGQEQNRQREAAELQEAMTLQGMLEKRAAQQQELASRADVARQQSLDRRDALAARREETEGRLALQKQFAEMQHQARMSQAANDAARQQEAARHNKVMEGINAQLVQMRADQAKAKQPGVEGGGQTPENAGKIAMGQQAIDGIGTVRSIIFDKDGKMNRSLVGAMNLPIVSGLPGNSQARIARSAIRNAVEAKLRIETGAAATESEVERTLARFLPTIADPDAAAKFKLDELEKFFKTSLSLTKGAPKPGGGGQRLKFDAQGNPVQ